VILIKIIPQVFLETILVEKVKANGSFEP